MRRAAAWVGGVVMVAVVGAACGGSSESEADTSSSVTQATTTTLPSTTVATTAPTTTTTTTAPTTTTEAPQPAVQRFSAAGLFDEVGQSAVIPHGEPGTWDGRYTDPGAELFHEGTLHVLQNGFPAWPARVGVGYWTSDDRGETWTEVSAEPVFDGTDLPYVGVAALASSLHALEDGSWVLYFYTWDQGTWPVSSSTIGRATAPTPEGPWTADPEPVLVPGPEGSWDELGVRAPSVIIDEDGWRMWYTGTTTDVAMIGLATSSDGITWVKHDDPATTDPAFAESDPVLVPGTLDEGNVWDQRNVYQPRVVASMDGLAMLYTSASTVSDPASVQQKIGVAVSSDGIDWQRSRGPVISAGDAGGNAIWWSELAYDGDRYYLLFELGVGGETDVYLATHDGSLLGG